ncbi:adenosylcobinamide-GDP ribazoletransferase, partial [Sinorhizobium meliloti]
LSRAAMVWHWSRLPPARRGGVAASAGIPEPGATSVALGSGVLLALVLFFLAGIPTVAVLLSFAAFGLAVPGFTRIASRKLGGHTGDTIGATQQLTEVAVLGALALAI